MKVREEIESIHKEFEKINVELANLRESTGVAIRRHDFLRGKLEILMQLEANGNDDPIDKNDAPDMGRGSLRNYQRADGPPNK